MKPQHQAGANCRHAHKHYRVVTIVATWARHPKRGNWVCITSHEHRIKRHFRNIEPARAVCAEKLSEFLKINRSGNGWYREMWACIAEHPLEPQAVAVEQYHSRAIVTDEVPRINKIIDELCKSGMLPFPLIG